MDVWWPCRHSHVSAYPLVQAILHIFSTLFPVVNSFVLTGDLNGACVSFGAQCANTSGINKIKSILVCGVTHKQTNKRTKSNWVACTDVNFARAFDVEKIWLDTLMVCNK